jgi:hypothetical protein
MTLSSKSLQQWAIALSLGWQTLLPIHAFAQAKTPDDLAAALPADIPEVISGGGWQADGRSGVYRGIVVVSPSEAGPTARVFVQWIGLKAEGGAPEIVKTMPIKDVQDRKLSNAQLTLEADADNEAIFVVTSFDIKAQKATTLAYKATKPGEIVTTPVPAGLSQPK